MQVMIFALLCMIAQYFLGLAAFTFLSAAILLLGIATFLVYPVYRLVRWIGSLPPMKSYMD